MNSRALNNVVLLVILSIILVSCGGGGSSEVNVVPLYINISGNLDTNNISAKPINVESFTEISLIQKIAADQIWAVAIDETGVVQSSSPLQQTFDFNLEVTTSHDYVIVFKSGSSDGLVVAFFMMVDTGGEFRSVISLPSGMQDLYLGELSIHETSQIALSNINDSLIELLTPPEIAYTDFDKDFIPDVFDWDVDGDGVVQGESTSVYYSLSGGEIKATSDKGSFSLGLLDNVLFLDGLYNTTDRTFTIYPNPGPTLYIDTESDLSLNPLYYPDIRISIYAFNIWMDSLITVNENGRMLSGDLRMSLFEPWTPIIVSANTDVDGEGTAGYDISLVMFGETIVSKTLTWEQLDAIGDDPESEHGYLAVAWLGLRSIEFAYQNIQQLLTSYEFCIKNKQALTDAGEGNPVKLACDTFPGDSSTGSLSYTWFNSVGDTNPTLTSGDSFKITYDNCWLDDTGDFIDEIFNGNIHVMNYIDIREPVINMGANYIVLDNLTRKETVENDGIYFIDTDSETTANSFNINSNSDGQFFGLGLLDFEWLTRNEE